MYSPLVSENSPSKQRENQEFPHKTHLSQALTESKCIANIALPVVLTGLLLYSRSMISMLFLGRLGDDLSLAGGSLAIGFANITGYSILSGLAMGMEPICGQAFGAQRHKLLGLTLQRTILLLLLTSIPISFLWLNMKTILLFCGQDDDIATQAQSYILFSLPDLFSQSLLHPLRIYLRTQSITLPLYCATFAILLHIPINYFLVSVLKLGIKGVAISGVWTNLNLVTSLIVYVVISDIYKKTWSGVSSECLKDWKTLINLAVPSCISVCLECWWYEIMILLCGLLINPRATVASMGVLIQTTSLIYILPSSLSSDITQINIMEIPMEKHEVNSSPTNEKEVLALELDLHPPNNTEVHDDDDDDDDDGDTADRPFIPNNTTDQGINVSTAALLIGFCTLISGSMISVLSKLKDSGKTETNKAELTLGFKDIFLHVDKLPDAFYNVLLLTIAFTVSTVFAVVSLWPIIKDRSFWYRTILFAGVAAFFLSFGYILKDKVPKFWLTATDSFSIPSFWLVWVYGFSLVLFAVTISRAAQLLSAQLLSAFRHVMAF